MKANKIPLESSSEGFTAFADLELDNRWLLDQSHGRERHDETHTSFQIRLDIGHDLNFHCLTANENIQPKELAAFFKEIQHSPNG
ncbi:hypothetical protein CEXT_24401 [Caerostris extrusa]|uniref:Uncharacterized protein n=1 Tax=Caerostris extrusa TaxID=172846 RepID=A0AAV4SMX1_CAEEX|nr:hypothetical protein CEXT_24401 [Caerostris extrusa]